MTKPFLALPAGALCLAAGLQAAAQRPPHIILLMADQQRADAMGCAGNAAVLTPHLDALAADGYRFNHAYSTCPSSTPARATLLTGLAPWHHGMLGYGVVAERRYRKTLAAMRQALADHMAERGAAWSENGQLKVRKQKTLYSPNYPK